MDSVILDTHAFIWYAMGNNKLSPNALNIIDSSTTKWVSIASIWEMAIKESLGKLTLKQPFKELVNNQISINNYNLLTVTKEHIFLLTGMKFHHRDPFDRLLIAQSQAEKIPVLSADVQFDKYQVERIW